MKTSFQSLKNTKKFSIMKANREKVRYWLHLLSPAMQDDLQIQTVKQILRLSKKDGLNPQHLYKVALTTRSPNFDSPAPKIRDIFPL